MKNAKTIGFHSPLCEQPRKELEKALNSVVEEARPKPSLSDRCDLRKDFTYNSTLAHQFCLSWIKECLFALQGRSKRRVARENLTPGQLVLVGDVFDIFKRGTYRLGRIHAVYVKRWKFVCRATVAVWHCESGEIEEILRDG